MQSIHNRRRHHTATFSAHICHFGIETRSARSAVLPGNSAVFCVFASGTQPIHPYQFVRSVPAIRLSVADIFHLNAFVASARALIRHASCSRHWVGVPLQLLRAVLSHFQSFKSVLTYYSFPHDWTCSVAYASTLLPLCIAMHAYLPEWCSCACEMVSLPPASRTPSGSLSPTLVHLTSGYALLSAARARHSKDASRPSRTLNSAGYTVIWSSEQQSMHFVCMLCCITDLLYPFFLSRHKYFLLFTINFSIFLCFRLSYSLFITLQIHFAQPSLADRCLPVRVLLLCWSLSARRRDERANNTNNNGNIRRSLPTDTLRRPIFSRDLSTISHKLSSKFLKFWKTFWRLSIFILQN